MDDAIGEPVQTVSLTLRSENSYLIGAAATASLNIVDNDLPMVSVRVSDGTCNESGDNGVFQIHSSSSETGNVTVSYTITPLEANGVQFTTLTGTVSVTKNNGSASVSVVPIADSLIEDALPVTITLTDSPNYVISTESTATIHLADDDGGNVVSISKESRSVTEGSTARFVLSREGSTTDSLTVNLLWSGTAVAGADFASPGDSVIFGAGINRLSIDVPTSNDGVAEGYETLMPTVAPGTGYTARITSASTYLLDANSASYNRTVGFAASTSTVAETAGSADISISLSGTATGPVSVLYRINGGTATGGGVDYQLGEGILTIPAGQTTGAISLPVIDDLFVETNETIILILESSSGAKFGTTTHTVTITSNDAGPNPQISFAQASSASAEAASSIVIPVNLAPPQTFAITVDYATSSITASDGLDFTATSGTIIFAPGETQKTISIPLLNDTIQESSESFAVTLTNPVPVTATLITPSTHTATILDDDTSTVSITAVDPTADEAGPAPALVSISRTGGTDGNLTVTYQLSGTATNGTDYGLLPGSFTIPAGQASADLTILPIDDAVSESLETVNITLTAGQPPAYLLGTTNRSVEITIADNENSAPTISLQSPVGGLVRLPALHQGLVLRATATDDGLPAGSTLSALWSQASGPGGVEFSTPASMETTAHFSAPGRYQLNLAVTDGSQSSIQSVVVDVEPITLDSLDVGNASTRPGSVSESNGTYTLTGSGTNLGTNDTTDGHFFVWRPMGGNFEIQTRLASIGAGGGANSRCGITMRSSSANNARHATMAATPTRVSFSYRLNDATSSSASTTNINTGITPRWFKLIKNGNVVSAFQSLDGTTWTQQGANQTFGTSADIWMVGLEVNSGSTSSSTTATFDSLQFHSANLAPSVIAGPDLSSAISDTASLPGTVTDTMPAALSHQWSAPSHATGVVFGNTSSASTTVAFAGTGSHRLRLTATDGISETFDELEATVLAPPTVSVTTQGPAGEFGPVAGQLTFHRTGGITEELSLVYTLAGSAAEGLDFASPGTVTIPAGASQISLSVLPLADAINEGTETIEVSIAPAQHYTLGSGASGTLLLKDVPFADWKSANFGLNANDAAQSGDASDPDFDGIDNLTEYGLALDPLIPATSLLPSSGLDATGLWLRFRKNSAALDLTYTPEWSVDHQNWETTGIQQEAVLESSPVPEIKAILPLNGSEMRRMMRVRIAK
jgi:hypothetical protein